MMLQPLLRTKTTIPPVRPKQVQRARLLKRLADGMKRALTLVIAPAGFGKTTLVAAWAVAQGSQLPVAWLSLQPADRSRERFLSYLVQALRVIAPHFGQTTLALIRGGSSEGAILALVNDLAGLDGDFVLVLDDYHTVDSPEISQIVQFVLENRPANLHLVLTTRVEVSLSLARLRASDQATEITAADLRFNQAEVRAFIEESMGLQLPETVLAELLKSTEGWAVGLQLLALALARQSTEWHIPAGQALIFEYLAKEVLHREAPQVQDFLIKTALFDRFCIPMCEAILHLEQSVVQSWADPAGNVSDILVHIERSNLFLIRLDADGIWFRYHALFTDFLRKQIPVEQTLPLYHAASLWCEKSGLLDSAIHYATHAGDFERAAVLLEDYYRAMLLHGEQAALVEWLETMPSDILDRHPRLWLAMGWANIISLDSVQAQEYADHALALLPVGEGEDHLRGEARALQILAGIFTGKVTAASEVSETFVLLSEQDSFLHSLLHFNLGLRHVMLGETAQAVDDFSETLRLTEALDNPLVMIMAWVLLGETRQMRGAFGLAERAFQHVIQYAREALGEHSFLLGMPFISYADLLREQNRFDEAVRYAEQGIDYCQAWQPVASMDGLIVLARIKAAQGEWEAAYGYLEQAMLVAKDSVSFLDDTFIAVQQVRLALLKGDLARAEHWIRLYDLNGISQGMYFHVQEMTHLALLRAGVSRLETDPKPALALAQGLADLMAESESRERITPVIEALILQAYAFHAADQHSRAVENLSRALALGAQSGYVRIFVDEGQRLQHLLEQYRSQIRTPRSYFENILAHLRKEDAHLRLPSEGESSSRITVDNPIPLTRRELDILELVVAGKTNQEIAAERFLSLNTVKKHVANILSKMGVTNRTQAAQEARRQGWV